MAGERFCVRNSGVKAVIEGIGDHGCEYMTGGTVVVLGATGKNFAAGMSGGTAFVYNPNNDFKNNCNPEMVDLDPLDQEDEELLRTMIRDHFRYTSSNRALEILNNWKKAKNCFTKVMPRDYKAALQKQKKDNFKIKASA